MDQRELMTDMSGNHDEVRTRSSKIGLLDLPNELLETIFAMPVWFRVIHYWASDREHNQHADEFFANLLDRHDAARFIRQLVVATDQDFTRLHAAAIARLTNLSFLRLDWHDFPDFDMMLDRRTFEILSKCPRLVHLNLRGSIDIPDDLGVGLNEMLPSLHHLSITGAASASALLKDPCTRLERLHLRLEVGDDTFPMIPWTSLRHLQLHFYDWCDSLAESFSTDLIVVSSCIEPADIRLESVEFTVEDPPSEKKDRPVESILTSLLSIVSPYDFWPSIGRFVHHFSALVSLRLQNVSSAIIVRSKGPAFIAKIQPLELPLAHPMLVAMLAFAIATSVLHFRVSNSDLRAEMRATRRSRDDDFVLEQWLVKRAEMTA
ncbi:hypothetical protein Rt10032_c11g4636 [Rhodotorula toruloides]|uniref:F-box domain-containing protein n=1 Tax=Rhodotorula toruloides TaxID=5286 RepID=A0A511KJS7_RHOTO|nr:hypothetical protein Rt10032_c11g4636 [Rhodotorula toruloides]